MKSINKMLIVLVSCLTSWGTYAEEITSPNRIEVFTDQPALVDFIAGTEVIHYDLSAPDRLKRSSLPSFPPDRELAMQQAKAFFVSPAGEVFKREMKAALRGKQKIIQYQLKKIPAIVFADGQYVIYGSLDLADAIQRYKHHLQVNDELATGGRNQ